MAQLKKPLEYKKIILNMTNDFYENYMNSIGTHYSVPADIMKYDEKKEKFKDIKHLEDYIAILESVKNEWKTFGSPNETIPVYFQLVFVNACNVLNSIKQNLAKEDIKGDKIEASNGIDILASTAMQILATIGNELTESYDRFELQNDKKNIFAHAQKMLLGILNQNAQDAFTKLIDNLLQFGQIYRQIQQGFVSVIPEPGTDDPYEGPRTQLLIAYSNGFIITAMMLTLLLHYPFENGMMPEPAFNQMKPNINLF
jgi:hypothetical protein